MRPTAAMTSSEARRRASDERTTSGFSATSFSSSIGPTVSAMATARALRALPWD